MYEQQFNEATTQVQSALASLDKTQISQAEQSCLDLIKINNQDPKVLQMLYFIYLKTNRLQEAVITLEKVSNFIKDPIKLARCYSDLGNMLTNLSQKEQAEDYLKKAINLNSSSSISYYNLGVLYFADNKKEQAIENFKEAIKYDQNFAMAYNNLARAIAENPANLEEVILYQKKAVELEPNSEIFLNNLSISLFLIGEFSQAITICQKILSINPNQWDALERLIDNYYRLMEFKKVEELVNNTLSNSTIIPIAFLKKLHFFAQLLSFTQGNYKLCKNYLAASSSLYDSTNKEESKKDQAIGIFYNYFTLLIQYYEQNSNIYNGEHKESIYVIGESHCLAPAQVIVVIDNINYKTKPNIITSCKLWDLISPYKNNYQASLKIILDNIPNNSKALFCFGEIDCRIDTGIMPYYRKNPTINLPEHIQLMAKSYIEFLVEQASPKELQLIIQGIPACNRDISTYPIEEQQTFLKIIKDMNDSLKAECAARNLKFLDVYSLTASDNGTSNGKYHIDGHHLKPHYILELLK